MIKLLELQDQKPVFFDANFIEDAALILISKLRDEGHLKPTLIASLTLEDGRQATYVATDSRQEPLSRSMHARRVHFRIEPGVRYHYARIDFTGMKAVSEKRARSFFIETSGLLPLRQNRIYSPARLKRGVSSLETALKRAGFEQASVVVANLSLNDRTGAASVTIQVDQGRPFMVRSARQEVLAETGTAPVKSATNRLLHAYSEFWEQDFVLQIKTNYYHRGYPDVAVEVKRERQTVTNSQVLLDLLAIVKPGPRVRTGRIEFEGNERTKTSFLKHHVPLKRGDWLDRMKAERGRYRLARLGAFESVELTYETLDTNLWDVHYLLKEGKRIELNLLFGYGSYDLLRGGVEVNQYNLWGLAHNQRLRLIQSFKSSSSDYKYTIPGLLGDDADVFMNASGLRREEVSFTRLEYGGGGGVRKLFHAIDTDVTVRYNYGILEATEATANLMRAGVQSPAVGEFIGDFRHDRRDNPLYPRRGYDLIGNLELASPWLAGDASFQRFDFAASCHLPLNDSEWIHLGIRHGVVATINAPSEDLPFVRRFFPGGENSVRGFQEGEAAPRNALGQIVGAETYFSGNVQFEQALTPRWSIVAFVDGVEFAERLENYPGNQALFSVGGGLNWRTIVGPVRLEYGYNLNPRLHDPSGTLHFSLGFPF